MRFIALCGLVAGFAAVLPAVAAEGPTNTSCAAIAFRPVAPSDTDGEQTAAYYKSHLGRIEIRTVVQGGKSERYFVMLNGEPLKPVARVPDAVVACAKAKRLTAPANPENACLGDRLMVLIAHTPEQRYLLLYAHHGNNWHFCSAGRS